MQPKLLVVDDERPLAESIAEYFEACGYDVDVAGELEEAEALIAGREYDVVITDLRLTPTAHEEGLELLMFVRQRWPRTLLLVLTAFPTQHSEQVARSFGACELLHKPQPLAEVEQRVRTFLDECMREGCGELCAPFGRMGEEHDQLRTDLRAFMLLFRYVRPGQSDAANAATLRELHRALRRIGENAPANIVTMLTSCLSGSVILNELLQATSAQNESSAAARRLVVEIARLSGDM
jgi:two-component system response regulator PilR (NtrC family)